jgi:hypothetical protein
MDPRAAFCRMERRTAPLQKLMASGFAILLVVWALAAGPLAALAQEPPRGIVPMTPPGEPPRAPIAIYNLQYFGGPVVSSVVAVDVLWGPNVDPTVAAAMPQFLSDLTSSGYMDWLCEYNTLGRSGPTTSQAIGRGSGGGQFTIAPQHTSSNLADSDIQSELTYQIQHGSLPAPQYDAQGYPETVYVIEFPLGTTITMSDGSKSCQQFCAYHSAMMFAGKPILYAIHPDIGPGSPCAGGCGSAPSTVANQESVHSHELIEAVTDPEVSMANTYGPPLAWYDVNNGEIGDICNASQASLTINGRSYTVQREWSNRENICQASDANLSAAPSVSGTASATVGGTISLAVSGGTAPYQWLVDHGSGPRVLAGQAASTLTISPAALGDAGAYSVFSKGSCSAQSSPWTVKVCPVISLSPSQLPAPAIGAPYAQALSASGGTGPYGFSVSAGSLPPGLTLSSAGLLAGTPGASGTFSFTVTATDSQGCTGSAAYTLSSVSPPAINVIKKASPPFKLVVMGTNFQNGIKVYIDGTQWNSVVWKNMGKILLTGAIKSAVPKGTTRSFLFVNPDGGEATTNWGW